MCFGVLAVTGYMAAGAIAVRAQGAVAQSAGAELPRLTDTQQGLGAFSVFDRKFSVVAHNKSLARANSTETVDTLAELEIRDGSGNTVYSENFPYEVQGDHFARPITASASLLSGVGYSAIVIRFLEETGTSHEDEQFEVFGWVNGKLAPFGAPLALGQSGSGTAVGDVLTGVMVGGGVDVEPLMSTAEVLQFRAWTGNFLVDIPVRVDWTHGRWSEGEECYGLNGGSSPQRRGCNLQIAGTARPRADGASVTLYAEPVEDHYIQQTVAADSKKKVEILGLQALVNWKTTGCAFFLQSRERVAAREN